MPQTARSEVDISSSFSSLLSYPSLPSTVFPSSVHSSSPLISSGSSLPFAEVMCLPSWLVPNALAFVSLMFPFPPLPLFNLLFSSSVMTSLSYYLSFSLCVSPLSSLLLFFKVISLTFEVRHEATAAFAADGVCTPPSCYLASPPYSVAFFLSISSPILIFILSFTSFISSLDWCPWRVRCHCWSWPH